MSRIGRLVLTVALLTLTALATHSSVQAAQIPGIDCQSTGTGTICQGTFSGPAKTSDTGASCGTGAAAFEILGTFTDAGHFEVYLNQQGLPTKAVIHVDRTLLFVNSTDPSKSISGLSTYQDILTWGIPGDNTTITDTEPGQVFAAVAPGFGLLFHDAGYISFAPDGTVTIHGPRQEFVDPVGSYQTLCPVLA
jgi:hypothetical protein